MPGQPDSPEGLFSKLIGHEVLELGVLAEEGQRHFTDRTVSLATTPGAVGDLKLLAEVGRVVDEEGIDCGFTTGGALRLARTRPQLERQRAEVEHARALGVDGLVVPLTADEARARLAASRVAGGLLYTAGARVQPVRLALGLADAVDAYCETIAFDTEQVARL